MQKTHFYKYEFAKKKEEIYLFCIGMRDFRSETEQNKKSHIQFISHIPNISQTYRSASASMSPRSTTVRAFQSIADTQTWIFDSWIELNWMIHKNENRIFQCFTSSSWPSFASNSTSSALLAPIYVSLIVDFFLYWQAQNEKKNNELPREKWIEFDRLARQSHPK